MRKSIQVLGDLVGEEISGIAFVRDYVEFHFDGPILRSIAKPKVTSERVTHTFPGRGSRDALCLAIGSKVERLDLAEGKHLIISLSNGQKITIPLDIQSQIQGESMHFLVGPNTPLEVW